MGFGSWGVVCRGSGFGFWVLCAVFYIFAVCGLWFVVYGLWFMVRGVGFVVSDLGFGVWGFGIGKLTSVSAGSSALTTFATLSTFASSSLISVS